jgi:hypothetical protein
MSVNGRVATTPVTQCATVLAGLFLMIATPIVSAQRAAAGSVGQSERNSSGRRPFASLPYRVRRTSRLIVGSIQQCCGFTQWATSIMST